MDTQALYADFEARQAERIAQVEAEIEHLKQAVLGPLRAAAIVKVEVRFDGCGDSGAIEECECFDGTNAVVSCPEVDLPLFDFVIARDYVLGNAFTLKGALDALTYLALERHHPGWEINEGSNGTLMIDVAEASFALDCSLRFTRFEDYTTDL